MSAKQNITVEPRVGAHFVSNDVYFKRINYTPPKNLSDLRASEVEAPSWIRGYHAYKDSWEIEIGESFELQHEPENQQDKNAIAIIKDGHVVGHMPKGIASTKQGVGIIKHFNTKPGSKGEVKVVGKAINRGGGYGMEVPCIFKFKGHAKYAKLLKNFLDIDNNLSVRKEERKREEPKEGGRKKKSKLAT